jgi:hypothetical protein
VSDHYTIELSICCHLAKVEKTNKIHKYARTRLDKVDKQEYRNVITKEIGKITEKISRPSSDLDDIVAKTLNLLHAGAKTCSPQKRYGRNKFKLRPWNTKLNSRRSSQ